MANLYRCLCILVFLALVAVQGAAQDKSSQTENDKSKIATTYDEARDETTVGFHQLEISETEKVRLFLSAEARYHGRTQTTRVTEIRFILTVRSPYGYSHPNQTHLTFLMGERKLGSFTPTVEERRIDGNDYVETMSMVMDVNEFFTYAQAGNMNIDLDGKLFPLNPQAQKRMVEFG
ncbi:MAG TPA: hypothetical protein VFC63_01740 [Blastocatellia bacterium]|nr:hypothetical protein [Blastocatellia bacterium]